MISDLSLSEDAAIELALDAGAQPGDPALRLTNSLTLDDGANIILNMASLPSDGDQFVVFDAPIITGDAVADLSRLGSLTLQTADGSVYRFLSEYIPMLLTLEPGGTGMVLDFRFDSALVPEPSTWVLLALGALGLFQTVRRRRK